MISGLACGKPIRGHVAFLGGPLHFLSELKESFIRTLKLDEEHIVSPENSHLFAAIGSALNADLNMSCSRPDIIRTKYIQLRYLLIRGTAISVLMQVPQQPRWL